MRKKHYSLDNILKLGALYMFLYGERSNGKSYAVKYYCLQKAFIGEGKFAYVRRWQEDLKQNRAETYWDDMETDDEGNHRVAEITDGKYDCISVYRNDIYFAKKDENGKKVRGEQIGRVATLTGDTHEKSNSYVNYYRIILEEAITDKGYLANEVATFMSLVSTILRRRKGEVFLIGNNLTKTCPYFREWELVNVPKQKQGTIDIYHFDTGEIDENGNALIVDIACEYCAHTGGATKMIIGNRMITRGEWHTEEKEHLPEKYGCYKRHCSVLIDDELEYFCIDLLTYERLPTLYVRLVDKPWTDYDRYDIVITERFHHEQKFVRNLSAFTEISALFKRLFNSGKICYQDNLVGTTFTTILNNRNIW